MQKDTVPPHKSVTRGTQQPAGKPVQQVKIQGKAAPAAAVARAQKKPQQAEKVKRKLGRIPIPSQRATQGLRWPKDREANIHKRLQKQSPWFQSIRDPLHGADAKIPDETGVETGTLQLVQKNVVRTNADGICGLRVVSPYINNGNLAYEDDGTDGWNWQYLRDNSTSTTLVWGADKLDETPIFQPGKGAAFAGTNEMKAITNKHRIVSACMIVEPEASGLDNRGEYTMFAIPYGISDSPLYNDCVNFNKSVQIPLSSPRPNGKVLWFPFYSEDWNFKSFVRTIGTTAAADDDHDQCYPMWMFGFASDGVAADVTFRVTIVINYEFVPTFNTLNVIDSSPSPQDAMESELVENWVQDMPITTPITEREATTPPSSVTPNHGETDEGTGFGMFFNVVKEILPLAATLLI